METLSADWEWAEVQTAGDPVPRSVRAACEHLGTVRVDLVGGEVVAQFCLACGAGIPLADDADAGTLLGDVECQLDRSGGGIGGVDVAAAGPGEPPPVARLELPRSAYLRVE